jgi:ligand-binding sensor domain-containing protein
MKKIKKILGLLFIISITSCSNYNENPDLIYESDGELEGLKIYSVNTIQGRVLVGRWEGVTSVTKTGKLPKHTILLDSNNILFENDSLLILKK